MAEKSIFSRKELRMAEIAIPLAVIIGVFIVMGIAAYQLGKYIRENQGLNTLKRLKFDGLVGGKLDSSIYFRGPGFSIAAKNVNYVVQDDPINGNIMIKVVGYFKRDDVIELL